jgi:hypothetical protein
MLRVSGVLVSLKVSNGPQLDCLAIAVTSALEGMIRGIRHTGVRSREEGRSKTIIHGHVCLVIELQHDPLQARPDDL